SIGGPVTAQAPAPAAEDKEPVLRLETGGPMSSVTALAFSPDGKTLYEAGLDKCIRAWTLDTRTGQFVLDPVAYRVPIGPGTRGGINTVAVSPDGRWLAAAGEGTLREGAGFRQTGIVLPLIGGMKADMREDQGTVYVFDTKTHQVKRLRGHRGPVLALAFAPWTSRAVLVSGARDWDEDGKKFVGGVRVWDVKEGSCVREVANLATGKEPPRPGLAVWAGGERLEHLRVGIAWDDGTFRLWDLER